MFNRRHLTALVISAVAAAAPAAAQAQTTSITAAQPAPVKLSLKKPGQRIFNQTGTFDSRRANLVEWVNYVYKRDMPGLGGRFVQPKIYHNLAENQSIGCGVVYNAEFCGYTNGSGNIGYNRNWSLAQFNKFGDGGFAAVMAHEYGHGAQYWLGFGNKGLFGTRSLYVEGFADCMAGGFMARMSNWGYLDNRSGRSDYLEAYNQMISVADTSPQPVDKEHGNAKWRTDSFRYGWQTGMVGCRNWGRQIAAGTAR